MPDLSHVVLESPSVLASGFKPGFVLTGEPNLYEISGGRLQLISILPNEEAVSEAGLPSGVGHNDVNMRGAISDDGTRVVFETGDSERLYLRDTALERTVQLNKPEPGMTGTGGVATFQAANSDGTKVFFTDASRLTDDSTARPGEPDLYMCGVSVVGGHLACTLSDLSVDHNAGQAANVAGEAAKVSAIDESGEHVYFAANGVLTNTPNARGEAAAAGNCEGEGVSASTCNLYEYDTDSHTITLVAMLSSEDAPDWAGHRDLANLGSLTARSSPDGHYFTFMSQRSLRGYDNRDARSGKTDEEVFLFDAETGRTSCVSCDPTGAPARGV